MKLSTLLGIAAIFFYVVSWFSYQDTGCLWGFGIALPWLSLIASIPINLLRKTEEDSSGLHWAFTYIIITILFAVVGTIITGSINEQIPHLAACVCLVSYFTIETK